MIDNPLRIAYNLLVRLKEILPADMRKCRNWQTSKTKDLVLATACGFKSRLPHWEVSRQKP